MIGRIQSIHHRRRPHHSLIAASPPPADRISHMNGSIITVVASKTEVIRLKSRLTSHFRSFYETSADVASKLARYYDVNCSTVNLRMELQQHKKKIRHRGHSHRPTLKQK